MKQISTFLKLNKVYNHKKLYECMLSPSNGFRPEDQ